MTRGPGVANASIGVHTAYQDSTPLIAMVGQVETDRFGAAQAGGVDELEEGPVAQGEGRRLGAQRLGDGKSQARQVVGMEGEVITLQDLFLFDYRAGIDEHGRFRGTIQPTGLRPRFMERLRDQGTRIDPELFLHDSGTIPMATRP